MLFFYIRHADPIYDPDSLTALGQKQAEALSKRLALYGVDKIYSSTSNRAILTAKPACDLLKKDMELVDFANEIHAWRDFTVVRNGVREWISDDPETKRLFTTEEVLSLGHKWYEYPGFEEYKNGVERIYRESFDFFKNLGYEHIKNTGTYKVVRKNDDRVALFAHYGFGMAFLSSLLDIPYPVFSNHFTMTHTGMTVIDFKEADGYATPTVMTFSSDSHLYREGLPTKYNNCLYF